VFPRTATRALHTTALDLGAARPLERGPLLALVNELVARHDFRWVNEDLGLWSLGHKPLPYPLPPYLTDAGLATAIANVRECTAALDVPLLVEFPGFAQGVSLPIGPWDPYDFFRVLADDTGVPVTLDVGHLLSARWLAGHRGADLYEELDRLPLDRCFEIHLSGCEIRGDRLYDAHHGVLLDEQLVLLERMLPRCPNVRAITYEDPAIEPSGELAARCRPSFDRLRAIASAWTVADAVEPAARSSAPSVRTDLDALDEALESLVFDGAARAAWRDGELDPRLAALEPSEVESLAAMVGRHLIDKKHVGIGGLRDVFPAAFNAWLRAHPDDRDFTELAAAFLASEGRTFSEGMCAPLGRSIEEAFAEFAVRTALLEHGSTRAALCRAHGRAYAICDRPGFRLAGEFRPCAGGLYAIAAEPPFLVAVTRGRYLEGPVTPLIGTLLEGASAERAAERHGVGAGVAIATRAKLVELGLLDAPPLTAEARPG
jgi:uncharacterized protein (UPF0276 family)